VTELLHAFLSARGDTPAGLRRAVLARAEALARGAAVPPAVPEGIAPWVDRVALSAHEATDGDVAALGAAGLTEDAILEITEAAALGASLARLDLGLAAIRGGG
jgi:alkylhydroperoxidase family enzyme